MTEQPRYFEEALADFVHDVASGGAIRHLVESGYSVDQIMKRLDYPTPRERVEKTVYRYMTESGMLLSELSADEETMQKYFLNNSQRAVIRRTLEERIEKNGEENCYMLCPFGKIINKDRDTLDKMLSDLTTRERDYILGVPWKEKVMYHRLNSRMLEIGVLLAANPEYEYLFYFLRSREIVVV
ncbi:MAG: hypothetical protein ACI4A3_04775 [Lachnospiraceae bacterium]